jgi:hypothetical protein
MNETDAILSLYIAVLSSDGSDIYCQGGTIVSPSSGNLVPGLELQADALTELYSPQTDGKSVLSFITGYLKGNKLFYFEQDFTVSK